MANKPGHAPEITILSSMAGREFEAALDRHAAWGITLLDLKDAIFEKSVVELSDRELATASRMISERGLKVYAISTSLFAENIEAGEAVFRQRHLGALSRVLEIAQELSPSVIRLIAASSTKRHAISDGIRHARAESPWLFELYDEAIDLIAAAGFTTVIENETEGSLLSRPEEALEFFDALSHSAHAKFTWDIVNMWQAGTFPTLEAYEALRPVIGYVHFKGGQSEGPSGPLKWKSPLDEASWPVREITERLVRDGICRAICLNPPHGELPPGASPKGWVKRDIDYLKSLLVQAL